MKQLGLLLLLLVAVSSSEVKQEPSNDITEYIEIIKCFLNQDNLINDISSLIVTIKAGEYDKLLQLALKIYADGTAAVKECIKKEEISLGSINSISQNLNGGFLTKEDLLLQKKIRESIIDYINKQKQKHSQMGSSRLMSEYEICMIGCQKMYIGYQLSMCYSICETFYKD